MAKVSVTNKTNTSMDLWVGELDTSYAGSTRTVYWYIDGDYVGSVEIVNGAGRSKSFRATGLSPGTSYSVEAVVENAAGETLFQGSATASTTGSSGGGGGGEADTRLAEVSPWSWSGANSSSGHAAEATAAQTGDFYDALRGNKPVSAMRYQVWNDLIYKAHQVVTAMANITMSSGNTALSAARWNALCQNFAQMSEVSGMETLMGKSPGDEVTGNLFTTFATFLNMLISVYS